MFCFFDLYLFVPFVVLASLLFKFLIEVFHLLHKFVVIGLQFLIKFGRLSFHLFTQVRIFIGNEGIVGSQLAVLCIFGSDYSV
jgi:hypothetical protein